MSEPLFKFTAAGGACIYAHGKRWHLPASGKPGRWMPAIKGKLIACERGYHLCSASQLVQWTNAELWLAEYRGDRLDAPDKVVVSQARLLSRVEAWNERNARLFAADCAEHVLHIFESKYPEDGRPRAAIAAARAFANGTISQEQMAAPRDAAGDAARDAAGDAARDAAGAAAGDAAWDAAGDAAWDAAGDAARAAAWDAEREWQTQRLIELLGLEP